MRIETSIINFTKRVAIILLNKMTSFQRTVRRRRILRKALLAAYSKELPYQQYVEGQLYRTLGKINKDASFRSDYLVGQLVRSGTNLDLTSSVLCVGCRNLSEINSFEAAGFEHVTGIDLQSTDPRILVMDMHNMNFADDSFDVVYATHVLEHSFDFRRAVSELVRVARPGAHAIVEVPVNFETNDIDRWDIKNREALLALFGCDAKDVLWDNVSDDSISMIFRLAEAGLSRLDVRGTDATHKEKTE